MTKKKVYVVKADDIRNVQRLRAYARKYDRDADKCREQAQAVLTRVARRLCPMRPGQILRRRHDVGRDTFWLVTRSSPYGFLREVVDTSTAKRSARIGWSISVMQCTKGGKVLGRSCRRLFQDFIEGNPGAITVVGRVPLDRVPQ